MNLAQSYRMEWLRNSAAILLVLSLIYGGYRLLRLLDSTLGQSLSAELMAQYMGLKLLGSWAIVLPLAIYLGLLMTLGRIQRDREWVVLQACGISPARFRRLFWPMMVMMTLMVAWVSMDLSPKMEQQALTLVAEAKKTADFAALVPGRFNVLGKGLIAYMDEHDQRRGTVQQIRLFRWLKEDEVELIAARQAGMLQRGADVWMRLDQGFRWRPLHGDGHEWLGFKSYQFPLYRDVLHSAVQKIWAMPSSELLQTGTLVAWAEWQGRLGTPIALLVLLLLTFPLSEQGVRSGRSGRLFSGVLVYMIYNNALLIGKHALEDGSIAAIWGLWWVHALFILILVAVLSRQARLH